MARNFKRSSILILLLSFNFTAFAAAPTSVDEVQSFRLTSMELSLLYANQGSNQNSTTGMIAWTPAYNFNSQFALRGNFGISALRNTDSAGNSQTFTVLDFELLARMYLYRQFDVEAGGGIQNWVNHGGGKGVFSINAGYDFSRPYLGLLDRIFIGYSNAARNVNANEFRAGFQLTF